MPNPTIEEDLATLKHALNKAAMLNSTLPAFDALDRVAAALKEPIAARLALLDELIALDDASPGALSVYQAVGALREKYGKPR
jgi:hypothetical protein